MTSISRSMRVAAACAVFVALPASAATIVGGSDLLSASSANQLESWLGQGDISLTNIFDKAAGDDSVSFHAAVDGKGATFSVIEVTGMHGETAFDVPVLIGGYNPLSWNSDGANNMSDTLAERTAFVFNLSQSVILRQSSAASGVYQTYNDSRYGPTFGGGYDLYVDQFLRAGSSYTYSYGDVHGINLARYPAGDGNAMLYGQIEVFSISIAPQVPEPEAYALLAAGLALIGLVVRRRRA